ncbi:MAG: hypothetical protein ACYTG0_03575 [Planctomycetota bacterium]|jgi:orotate phosphoribosyltransferase
MNSTNVGDSSVKRQLSDLGAQFFFTAVGKTRACPPIAAFLQQAAKPFERLDVTTQHHLNRCPRCAQTYSVLHGALSAHKLPDHWDVVLRVDKHNLPDSEIDLQVLGYVSLEAQEFEVSDDEESWFESPLHMRVNLVIDRVTNLIALTILDVPSTVQFARVDTPAGAFAFEFDKEARLFEIFSSLSDFVGLDDADEAGEVLVNWLLEGRVRIRFDARKGVSRTQEVPSSVVVQRVLEHSGIIERLYDYELPSGLHSDTHVNVAELCASEELVEFVAASFRKLFDYTTFDTVIANGWAMATVARRLAWELSPDPATTSIRDIICEGYDQVVLTGDVLPGSKVLILVDVNVSGRLIQRIQTLVRQSGSEVVAIGALVQANSSDARCPNGLRYLTAVDMDIVDPAVCRCSRCDSMEHRSFNPVSQCMTARAPFPRSPSEFLAQNADAREFWKVVNALEAYEHHHKEDDSATLHLLTRGNFSVTRMLVRNLSLTCVTG